MVLGRALSTYRKPLIGQLLIAETRVVSSVQLPVKRAFNLPEATNWTTADSRNKSGACQLLVGPRSWKCMSPTKRFTGSQ